MDRGGQRSLKRSLDTQRGFSNECGVDGHQQRKRPHSLERIHIGTFEIQARKVCAVMSLSQYILSGWGHASASHTISWLAQDSLKKTTSGTLRRRPHRGSKLSIMCWRLSYCYRYFLSSVLIYFPCWLDNRTIWKVEQSRIVRYYDYRSENTVNHQSPRLGESTNMPPPSAPRSDGEASATASTPLSLNTDTGYQQPSYSNSIRTVGHLLNQSPITTHEVFQFLNSRASTAKPTHLTLKIRVET